MITSTIKLRITKDTQDIFICLLLNIHMEQTVINPVDPPSKRLPAMFYKAGDPIHSLADLIIRVLSALFIPCIHETADRPFSPIFFLHKQDRGQTGHAPVHTCKYKKPHSHIEQLLCHRRKVTLDPAERRIRCETSADRTPCSLRAAQPVSGKICPHKQHQTKRRPEDFQSQIRKPLFSAITNAAAPTRSTSPHSNMI